MLIPRATGPAAALLSAVLLLLLVMGAAEAQRPMFHVRPPANWINDPNGPYRDPITGKMHLYMQYNPFDSVWGEMHWYHFTSDDYVTWQDEGIALKNNQWYDHWGAYSGSITHNPEDGTPVMMYTCVSDLDVQRQCIAVPPSKDIQGPNAPRKLNTFIKPQNNPVLIDKDVPGIVGVGNFRDPTNFWKNPDNASEWLVAFVARIEDKTLGDHGHVVVFKTADKTWRSGFTYSHSLWHEEHDFYRMLECPDFFPLGKQYFMKVSTMISRQDIWVYGNYAKKSGADKTTYAEDPERTPTYIDYGRWYASKQNYDPLLNRTILWGWIVEEIDENEVMRAQGWSGMMDMPRNIEYDNDAKKLKTYPMPELEKLRMTPLVKDMKINLTAGGQPTAVYGESGRHYELVVDFELPEGAMAKGDYKPGDEPSFGVDVLGSADGQQYARIAVTMPFTVAPGEDLTGRSYSVVNAKDNEDCKAKCEHERRCVAWTSVKKDSSYTCTLRSTIGEAKAANDTTTSGRASEPVLLLDRTKSGTAGFTDTWAGRAPLHKGNKVQLRVFVDGTAVQVFKDGGLESLSARVYVGSKEMRRVSLFASNIKGTVKATATLYPMGGVYAASALDTNEEDDEPAMRDASGTPVHCGIALLLLLAVLVQALL